MKKIHIILLQLATALVVGAIAALLGGKNAGISSLLAGFSCVVPNALFLMGLHISERLSKNKATGWGLSVFFFSELLKIALTIVLLIVVLWQYQNVNWLSFIVSFIIVMKSYIFLLSRFKN